MPNRNRWNLRILTSLVGVASLVAALPVEARPIFRSPYYRESRPLGPVPYRGPVITHIPIGSATGSPNRLRSSYRYDTQPNSVRFYRESYPIKRVIRHPTIVSRTTRYYRDSYRARREGMIRHSTLVKPKIRYYGTSDSVRRETIRDSTLVNPTIINSEIDDSVLINPTIVQPDRHRSYERRYIRRRYHAPSSGIYIQFGD